MRPFWDERNHLFANNSNSSARKWTKKPHCSTNFPNSSIKNHSGHSYGSSQSIVRFLQSFMLIIRKATCWYISCILHVVFVCKTPFNGEWTIHSRQTPPTEPIYKYTFNICACMFALLFYNSINETNKVYNSQSVNCINVRFVSDHYCEWVMIWRWDRIFCWERQHDPIDHLTNGEHFPFSCNKHFVRICF